MQAERKFGETVVVPDGGASSVACLRALGEHGIRTIGISESEQAPALASKYCTERRIVPDPKEDRAGFRDELLDLAARADVRAIAPMREVDVFTLARYRSDFTDHLLPTWPDLETLREIHDRTRLVEIAADAGVATPETYLLGDVDDWERQQVVKPRFALLAEEYNETMPPDRLGSPGSAELLQPGVEPDREQLRNQMGHEPIVQEYVPGSEYALWALYDDGEAVATCGKHQLRAYKYSGGTSIARETTSIPALERAGRAVLDALEYDGPASVQFVRDERTGEFTLLEVNPRFWLSLSCPVVAGLDFPQLFWQLAGGETVNSVPSYEDGVATHLLRGEAVHLHSVLRDEFPLVDPPPFTEALREVAVSVYEEPNFDYLSLTDPGPFLRDAKSVVPLLE
ncbi:carboxylate--amine ligase [Natranaeroarchaeum sulfidigenes]|uniref:Putative ATP-grasp enzyme n=1 Tax=Natranaeroarchaeum sulfidigenes TaxID=2784880 RepID=A0A897MHF5_9EURY|nr:ATP-grasp domain-containing protein [Natranaeroarchaeum sulfidigenes]QSG01580.1 putative ATP-grasp enzyme [Natranaeroarchaeum sulfidigenes]